MPACVPTRDEEIDGLGDDACLFWLENYGYQVTSPQGSCGSVTGASSGERHVGSCPPDIQAKDWFEDVNVLSFCPLATTYCGREDSSIASRADRSVHKCRSRPDACVVL